MIVLMKVSIFPREGPIPVEPEYVPAPHTEQAEVPVEGIRNVAMQQHRNLSTIRTDFSKTKYWIFLQIVFGD
jgi:hypothetical protein